MFIIDEIKKHYKLWLGYIGWLSIANIIIIILLVNALDDLGYLPHSALLNRALPLNFIIAIFITFKTRMWMSQNVSNIFLKIVSYFIAFFVIWYISISIGSILIYLYVGYFL